MQIQNFWMKLIDLTGWRAWLLWLAVFAALPGATGGETAVTEGGDSRPADAPTTRRFEVSKVQEGQEKEGLEEASGAEEAGGAVHLHVTGIGGQLPPDYLMVAGLRMGGVKGEIRVIDWTGEQRGITALVNEERHRVQSTKLAEVIKAIRAEKPGGVGGGRLTITSHSGGAGITAWALEKLPEGVTVDDWVMIAPALSPGYDLSKALQRVNGKCFAIVSWGDAAVLGTGTRMMGTIDRVKTDAAGRVGFKKPAGADEAAYAKLVEVPYDARFMKMGNNGEHIGPMLSPFAAGVIAPVIKDGKLPEWVGTRSVSGH